MIRLRHTDELVGLLVLFAAIVFLAAILEAGFIGRWFQPTSSLRILLPATGGSGLSAGADIEVLGTHAGTVQRVVIRPDGTMYAMAEIDNEMRAIVPRDSTAVIRRRYGIAGAAYIEILRGSGAPMDWNYAVINAATERDPTDNISALVDEARQKVFPILTDVGSATHSLAVIMEKIEHGEGNAGRVVNDESLMRSAETAMAGVNDGVQTLNSLLSRLDASAGEVGALVKSARDGKTGVPALLRQVDQILTDFRPAVHDLGTAATRTPAISHNIEETSKDLPGVLQQTEVTAAQLEKLLAQLRGLWFLGGDSGSAEPRRLTPTQARP